jgi:hypothetical protein
MRDPTIFDHEQEQEKICPRITRNNANILKASYGKRRGVAFFELRNVAGGVCHFSLALFRVFRGPLLFVLRHSGFAILIIRAISIPRGPPQKFVSIRVHSWLRQRQSRFQKSKNSIDILPHSTKTAVHSRASREKTTALKRAGASQQSHR